MTEFFKRYGEYVIQIRFFESTDHISIQDLYEEFKKQLQQDEDQQHG